ncbi:MAG: hypothetical protein ABIV28_07805 [Longimicrobiales bacterium]
MAEQQPIPRNVGSTVRQSDIEPYTALRWVGTLFKVAAGFLVVALIGQFVAELRLEGRGALPQLLGELARTMVFAVVLWGGGDLVRLLVQLGNDIRAQRILLSRLVYRTGPRSSDGDDELRHGSSSLDPTGLLETGDAGEDAAARRSLGTTGA